MIALVGPSGAGKTTVTYLMQRFYDPQRGAVRLDGHDIRELTLESISGARSAPSCRRASSSTPACATTCATAGPRRPTDEVLAAAHAAGLGEMLARMPDGIETIVGERGYRLSGGEKQRVSIARAILNDPPILFSTRPPRRSTPASSARSARPPPSSRAAAPRSRSPTGSRPCWPPTQSWCWTAATSSSADGTPRARQLRPRSQSLPRPGHGRRVLRVPGRARPLPPLRVVRLPLGPPRAHRAPPQGREDVIEITIVDPIGRRAWLGLRRGRRGFVDASRLRVPSREAYLATDPSYSGRATVPVLWDNEQPRSSPTSRRTSSGCSTARSTKSGPIRNDSYPEDAASRDRRAQRADLSERQQRRLPRGLRDDAGGVRGSRRSAVRCARSARRAPRRAVAT